MISESGNKLLSLLFNEGESVCVSHNEFGYLSVPLENLDYEVLEMTSIKGEVFTIKTSDIKLLCLNPISGRRQDENCTAFRTFLVEMDDDTLPKQLKYVKDMEMPYSACVYSGSKSLHFAITLDQDLPSYEIYYYYATWILNVMDKADKNTKNPSRSIRMAGAMRETGREQKLVQIFDRISLSTLNAWLSNFEKMRPKNFFAEKREKVERPESGRADLIPTWVMFELDNGIDTSRGRNSRWFQLASEFGKAGFSEEETVNFLDEYFTPEYDFKKAEWLIAVRSGVKNGHSKAGFE